MFSSNTSQVSGESSDPQFNYVTMLLHGDGTNGGQNNTFLDSSTNNFTITRNGNTTQGSFSPYGTLWSNYFPSSASDYLSVADNAALDVDAGDFTVEAWIYIADDIANVSPVMAKGFGSAGGWMMWVQNTLRLRMYDAGGASVTATSSTSLTAFTWNHVAATRSGNTLTVYINGTASGTATFSGTSTNSSVLEIGGYNSAAQIFHGYISNARLVKGTAVYTGNFTPSTTPLTAVSGTSLLTCQSNRFIDNSANNFSITLNGAPSVQRFSPFNPSAAYSTATIGGSGYFDGSGDYLRLPASSQYVNDGSTNLTIEFWAYANTGGYYYLCDQGTGNKAAIAINFDPTGGYVYWYNGTNYMTATTPSTLKTPAKTWIHFAFVRNGGTCTIYVNGQSVDTGTNNYAFGINSTFDIGWYSAGSSAYDFPGYISNFRYVNGTAVYTSNFTPPTAPLSAITNTVFLLNMVNAAIFDNAMMNDLETVGNAQISTSVKKYGTGSLAFNGTTDYLTTPTSSVLQLGAGDFTIEWWAYPTASVGGQEMIALSSFDDNYPPLFGYQSGSTWQVYLSSTGSSWDISSGNSLGALAINTWTHYAITRSGSTFRAFENGVQQSTWTSSANIAQAANKMTVGNGQATHFFKGYIDDLRITKGYARYTANFTPPTQAFPNN